MCLSSGSNFQLGWEVDGGVVSKGTTHAKKVLNYLWCVTPALPNIPLHRLDPFTGLSRDEMNFISICGTGEIPWSRYIPKCAIISFFVKSLNPLYLPLSYLYLPSLPLFAKLRTKNTHTKAVTIEEFQSWTNTKAAMANTGRIGASIRDSKISQRKK